MKMVRRSAVPTSFVTLTLLLVSWAFAPLAIAQDQVQRVEITGSSIKRIEGETALPVQVITRQELEQSGATNVEQFMQGLGVALQGNSNTVAASASGVTSGGVSGVSLRGLGSQRTLVLIDGKRVSAGGTLTDSTTVDINLIPLAAVERVEVLKDGASAVYGSEAIAGVVNFILRKDYRGAEAGGYTALTQHPGGKGWGMNYLLGLGDMGTKGWNFTGTIDVRHEDAIFGAQRSFASSGIIVPYWNDVTSGNTFPANIAPAPPPGGATRNPAAPGLVGTPGSIVPPACPGPYSNVDGMWPAARCRFDPSPLVSLIPKTDTTGLFGGLRFKLSGDHELYGQAGYTHKESETVIQPVPISDQFALPPNHPLFNVAPYNGASTIVITPASPFYPTAFATAQYGGTPDLLVRYRSAETGNRDVTDVSDFYRLVGGIRGTFVGWDYDASLLHVETNLKEVVNNGYPSLSAILPVLNGGNFNPFGPQPASTEAQIQASQFRGDAYKTKTTTDSAAAKASRDLTRLPGGPLGFAVGVEERREGFKLDTPPIVQIGDISGYGGNFLPVDVNRRVTSAFTEFNVPIIRSVEVLAATRYDDYEGTGSKISPKLGLRWQPLRQVLFRGSVSKGFRAPSLTELFQPQTTGVSSPGITDPARCPTTTPSSIDCNTQFPITLGGNTALRPETSINRSIGFVLEPVNNVSMGVDYWEVDLSNTIIFGVSPQFILDHEASFPGFVTRAAPDAACPGCPGRILNISQTNTNLGETHVKGFDFTGLWRIPMRAAGALTFNFNGTYMYRYDLQNLDGSFNSINGMVSPITNGSGGVIPRWRHYLTADWRLNPWDFAVVWQYQSHYKDIAGTIEAPLDPTVGNVPGVGIPTHEWVSDYSLIHLYGTYNGLFNKNLQVTVGVRNLFDKSPPYSNAGGQNYFQAGYDPGYADPRGRTFLLQAKFKFQ